MEKDIETLFRRYVDNELQPDDEEQLQSFVSKNETNERLFNDFTALYKVELQVRAAQHIDTARGWSRVIGQLYRRRLRRHAIRIAAAVAIIAVIMVPVLMFMTNEPTPTMGEICRTEPVDKVLITISDGSREEISTNIQKAVRDANGNILCENSGRRLVLSMPSTGTVLSKVSVMDGSTYEVDLPDGSVAHVNSNSELTFTAGRRVSLRGEAYFEVKHDSQIPFTVECGGGVKVTVLGTKFNVSARRGQPVVVTLSSGRVHVTATDTDEILEPGEQLTVTHSTVSRKTVNTELYTSWAKGMYDFSGATMGDIISQLSLWYGVNFSFATPELRERTFTGAILKYKPLGYTLEILSEVSNISFKMKDGTIIVSERKSSY